MIRSVNLLLVGCLGACAGLHGSGSATTPATATTDFRLGPEDVVEIVVWDNPALSRTVPIRPDGMISLPLIDDIVATGLTPLQLRDLLAARIARYVPKPAVSVIVQQIHSPKIVVLGEVVKPGRFELTGPTTVLEAIALAGGFTEFASSSRVDLLRPSGERVQRFELDRGRLTQTEGRQNVWLSPGDVVLVP
jgi:polysaccharide export outer membrane protein